MNLYPRPLKPAFRPTRIKGDAELLDYRRSPLTTRPNLAMVVSVDDQNGEVTCEWITASDGGSSQFQAVVTQQSSSSDGSHFGGGLPGVGEIVAVSVVVRNRASSYRIIGSALDTSYATNIQYGHIPQLRAGERLQMAFGGQMHMRNSGTVHISSGYRSPGEIEYKATIRQSNLSYDHTVPMPRDHITLWNDIQSGEGTSLRTILAESSSAVGQIGLVNRFQGFTDQLRVDRISDNQAEVRFAILDDERRNESTTMFIGPGYAQDGSQIVTSHGGHAVGGFRFTNQEWRTSPGLLWDNLGRLEFNDAWNNRLITDTQLLKFQAASVIQMSAPDMFSLDTSTWQFRAKDGFETFSNLSTTIGGDSYLETIIAEHQVARLNVYKDVQTFAPPQNGSPEYLMEIAPSPVARFQMLLNSIEFGNDTSISNIKLEALKGTLGKDEVIGQIVYDAAETSIGKALAQARMIMLVDRTTFGTGTPIDVQFTSLSNTIRHSLFNVINAAQNYFGTDSPNISQPLVKGTALATLLASFIGAMSATTGAMLTLFPVLAAHTHASAPPGPPVPSGELAAAVGATIPVFSATQGTLTSNATAVPGTLSIKNFTE